jgi:hypothetical protein
MRAVRGTSRAEVRMAEVRIAEVRLPEIRSLEIRPAKIRPAEVCLAAVGAMKSMSASRTSHCMAPLIGPSKVTAAIGRQRRRTVCPASRNRDVNVQPLFSCGD